MPNCGRCSGTRVNLASEDPDIYSVIVTGSSNTFSSGVDLSSMMGDGGAEYEEPFETCIDALINFKKPLIGAVEGAAVGGGATILLHLMLFLFLLIQK